MQETCAKYLEIDRNIIWQKVHFTWIGIQIFKQIEKNHMISLGQGQEKMFLYKYQGYDFGS